MKLKAFDKSLLNVKTDKEGNLKAFTISRAYWGTGNDGGSLLKPSHKMCCLGFASLACGVPKTSIFGNSFPSDVSFQKENPTFTSFLNAVSTAEEDLAEVNDATDGKFA